MPIPWIMSGVPAGSPAATFNPSQPGVNAASIPAITTNSLNATNLHRLIPMFHTPHPQGCDLMLITSYAGAHMGTSALPPKLAVQTTYFDLWDRWEIISAGSGGLSAPTPRVR